MRRLITVSLVAAGLVFMSAMPASAGLIGVSVLGELNFAGGSTNFFLASNGFVPVGFLNQTVNPVIVAEPAVEFGFDDGANLDTANFTDTQLIVGDLSRVALATGFTMRFTSAAFAGLTLTEVSDSFPNGVTGTLLGNVITITLPSSTGPFNSVATFNLAPAAVPEPVPALLLGAGLVGLACRRLRH